MQDYLSELRAAARPEKAPGYSTTISRALEVWGTPVPEIRALARKLVKEADPVGLCRQLWKVQVREPRILAAVALQSLAKKLPQEVCKACVEMSEDLCHWEETDQLSVALWESSHRIGQVEQVGRLLATQKNPWQKRLAIVFLIRGLRKGLVEMSYLDELLSTVKREKRALMRKAVDWVLREAAKAKPDEARVLRRKHLGP